ncbi:hypothetical protein BN14_05509 [Rhizoctonia solani AG-1 IB]|uniref:Uncharacterized protein n=1 Tax=Thanatephorus cucumeris (strain AG1-IB / isolate 7/3/14) TaxID=1108050 RepID=M5C6F9_THACB|nr:hypothetical protein BN14_05509 [Rhizoctonia solani AG-1 IB]
MADTRTLSELRRLWKSYADFPRLPADRKNRIAKEQIQLSNSVGDAGSVAMSQSRSAGMLWPQAMEPVAKLFRKYWETGTTFSLASEIKSATNLNPTFIYSLSGEGFNPHYGTFPCGFHLITGFAPIKSDPAGPPPSTGSAAINTSKQQFAAWCRAFQKSLSAKSLTIRFFAGDALQFCRALDQYRTTGDPSTDLFVSAYRATQINFYRPTIDGTIPMVFDVIDTSNLTDHLGLFNLLLVAHGLLKDIPHTQAVLYTETLIPSGRDATKSFLDRILTDVPTLSMLFGIAPRPYVSNFTTHCNAHEVIFTELKAQYHERVAWSGPSGGDNLLQTLKARTISFEADSLARILYSIYDNMFAAEKIGAMMSSMALNPNSMIDFSKVHFQRETVALLFQVVQRRVHLCSGDWEQVVMKFFAMCTSAGGRIIESNCFQDLCLQLHLHGVYTVDTLKPDWASNPEFRFSPHSDLFNSWSSTPPVVCVVLTVPRQRLGVFFETPEKIGSPTLQAGLWTPDTHDNLYSAIYLSWGKCVTPNSSDRVLIEEDPSGQNGKSDLVVSFWASSRLTEIPGTQVSLRIKSTPQSTFAFMSKLGMSLDVFHASIMDKKYVHVLPYRPGLSSNLSQNPPLRPARMSATSIVGPVCHAIASNSQSQGVDSLSIRFDVTTKSEQEKLQNGAQVSANQVSACVMELKVGDHSHMLSYPYPIHGKNNRLRIARKSHYVEVVVPVSTPNDYSGYFLNAAPIINPGAYTTWNIHHVNLDRLPDLDDRVPEKLGWLNTLTALQLSEREKDIRNGEETHKNAAINALVNVKDSIHAITMNASGVQGVHTRTIGLCEPNQGGVYVLFLIGGIKLDSACSSIVLDTAVIPLSNDRMPALVRGIQNMQNKGTLAQINTVSQLGSQAKVRI